MKLPFRAKIEFDPWITEYYDKHLQGQYKTKIVPSLILLSENISEMMRNVFLAYIINQKKPMKGGEN